MTETNDSSQKGDVFDRHGGKIIITGFLAVLVGIGGCTQLLVNYDQSIDDKKDREQKELEAQIESQFKNDGLGVTSFSASNKTVKLILGACQVDADYSVAGGGWNGLDPLEDITGYTVTQKTDDGRVTRITQFEDSFDLQEQVGEDPCAYFFVD